MHGASLCLLLAWSVAILGSPLHTNINRLLSRNQDWNGFFGGAPGSSGSLASCDLSQAQLPTSSGSSTQLPNPQGTLAAVAIGRGTQNYTCDLSNSTAVPTPVGAIATLFDVSCIAAYYPDGVSILPALVLDIARDERPKSPLHLVDWDVMGHHYFVDSTTPVWNLNTENGQYGITFGSKVDVVTPPADSPVGQFNKGYGAVSWLYLTANSTYPNNAFSEIYRVSTAGGNPPTTCTGHQASFVVNYAAAYWFYK